jgi:acetyltransferase-like isoleucine patch superfamily enzyme
MAKQHKTHGDGAFELGQFRSLGRGVVFEGGVLVFHPESIEIGDNIYVGHRTILKGYYRNSMTIGDNTWIGQDCFFHSAGGLRIGKNVGIAPHVKILTSSHKEQGIDVPIVQSEIDFREVSIGDDCDIGIGSIILPGVAIGKGVQIGAGSVVTKSVPDYSVAFGVPAQVVRSRN